MKGDNEEKKELKPLIVQIIDKFNNFLSKISDYIYDKVTSKGNIIPMDHISDTGEQFSKAKSNESQIKKSDSTPQKNNIINSKDQAKYK